MLDTAHTVMNIKLKVGFGHEYKLNVGSDLLITGPLLYGPTNDVIGIQSTSVAPLFIFVLTGGKGGCYCTCHLAMASQI